MKKLLFILLLTLPFFGFGQSWEKTFGGTDYDDGRSVQQTNDGGYIICGWTHSYGNGDGDVYLIKTNENGIYQWSQTFGGSSGDGGRIVQQTNDGGYIICGDTESFGNGDRDIYIIKTDEYGDSLWTKKFGGINKEEGYHIQQTTDGGYIFCGRTESFGNVIISKPDIYIVKIDENGIEEWYKTFGGVGWEVGYSIQQTNDGGYIICGDTESNGNVDVYVIKTDEYGDSLWTQTYGSSGVNWEVGNTIHQTIDGGYFISGQSGSSTNGVIDRDILLIKTDGNGNELWYKTFGEINMIDVGNFGQQTSDGGYIVTGYKEDSNQDQDVYILKTDEYGDSLWTKKFGGLENDKSFSIQQTTDNGYIICGYTESFGNLYPDIYVIKTDSQGNITSTFNIPISSNKKSQKVVDMLGRDVNPQQNTPFIEIYDDGSTEKKIIIE